MIQKMKNLEDKELFDDAAWVLLDSAKLAEGLEPTDSTSFAKRVASLATKAL
jgi:HSP90 family molecular chaperone